MSAESVESFMKRFFAARSSQLERELLERKRFRNDFYSKECEWDSRRGAVERSEREYVLTISRSADATLVITGGTAPWDALRYRLMPKGNSWVIASVQGQCSICGEDSRDATCHLCHGTGWLDESIVGRRQQKHISLRPGYGRTGSGPESGGARK